MSEPFLGELKLVSFGFQPKGWALCAGQLIAINQNTALFSLLGTMYGGDGISTFGLPDLRGRVALGAGGNYVAGQFGGEETHTLTAAENAPHSHAAQSTSAPGNQAGVAGAIWASDAIKLDPPYRGDTPNAALNALSIQPAGGGQPHDNMQPFLVLQWIIALQGIFPSRA